jgi:hypothetical protein
MKKTPAKPKPVNFDREILLVFQFAASISIASFFFYLQKSDLLLYGDAVAHINIARRVFDSRTPGLLQLGTVWLPLPHLLMVPFLFSRFLWQTGIGGSIPSMFGYVFSVAGVFQLVRTLLPDLRDPVTRFAPWLASAIFALNPNLIYLQTTAMTEPLYLAFFIWTIAFFAGAIRKCAAGEVAKANSSLLRSGLGVVAACLTRYDGWLLAAVLSVLIVALAWFGDFAPLRPGAKRFVLLAAAAPAFWLAYNATVYRNPLEFANGPYSAKAIERKTSVPEMPAHPGDHDLRMAFKYYFKSAELNIAAGRLQILWVAALLFGTAVVVLFQRKLWPLLLLWIPVPFYMLSVAYSGVPIFLPVWWPFSHYNVRYGIELLPAIAAFTSIASYGLMRFVATIKARTAVAAAFLAFGAVSYIQLWRAGPVSLQEAIINSRTRVLLERQLAAIFRTLPSNSTFLMYLGDHVGAFQQAGIPLSQTINEGNHRPWKQPSDPEGLWERALAHPAASADFVIAFDHDAVAAAVNKSELQAVTILRVTGQPGATIYRTLKSNQPH